MSGTTTTMHRYGDTLVPTEPAPGLPGYLVRVLPGEDHMDHGPLSCDYVACCASEIDDIIEGKGTELIPIYLDTRYEVEMCRRCVEKGKHLEEDDSDA